MFRVLRNLFIAAVVSAVATGLIRLFWKLIGGGALPLHGWIALSLGVLGTVALAWVLMGLAFKSSREGWDDRVDNTLDPGRDDADRS
ncbi:MAG: hypothetical protein PSV23_13475 [Brevundimonas sp.]|uniref:hypothetical protein n=1 Tax=Brevundimonas sp. TaxID=1871086 RepID=UPI002487EE63|nr:hypothetical protein [Brevundimonas sp.]MDI1327795.1 hypothetical protein [Brevundimonas sp.]